MTEQSESPPADFGPAYIWRYSLWWVWKNPQTCLASLQVGLQVLAAYDKLQHWAACAVAIALAMMQVVIAQLRNKYPALSPPPSKDPTP